MPARQLVSTTIKVALSAALIAYLGWQAYRDDRFYQLAAQPKNWLLLASALPICLAAVTVTILRWQLFVRALGLDFTTRDALRAGFVGYLVNLAPFGLVGGDSLKAVMLIHKNPRRKTEAVASVLVDRVIGLYALLLLAAGASVLLNDSQLGGLAPVEKATIANLCRAVQLIALVSTTGLMIMLLPGVTESRLWDLLEHAPLIGPVLHKLVGAMRVYRRRVDVLLAAIGISLTIHLLYVSSVAVMTTSIGIAPEHRPPLGSIFVIVPPSMIAGALPIGAYELTLNLLFRSVSPAGAPQNAGLLIALAYRIIQICIASIGVAYWLTSRSEVRESIHEAQDAPPEAAIADDERLTTLASSGASPPVPAAGAPRG
ncbi:MAG: flippase-like domain-containing protein [Planctomycetaceae bacterium]|nr:flippase-like domain-containing protein [Planctomycetaceae bacterium]